MVKKTEVELAKEKEEMKQITKDKNTNASTTKLSPSQINTIIGIVISLILVVANYFLWLKDLLDLLHMGIGFRIFYFVFGFFVCLGYGTLILNTYSAMQKIADKK